MFAVIKTGGKQYRVAADQVIKVDKVTGEPGDIVEFPNVLMLGGDAPALGTPTVAGAMVAGEVVQQGRDRKVIAFKKRRRKNSRRKRGHRQEYTLIRVTEILTGGQKPTKTARPKAEARPHPAVTEPAETAEAPIKAVKRAKPKAEAEVKPAAAKPKAPAKKAAAKPKSAGKVSEKK